MVSICVKQIDSEKGKVKEGDKVKCKRASSVNTSSLYMEYLGEREQTKGERRARGWADVQTKLIF